MSNYSEARHQAEIARYRRDRREEAIGIIIALLIVVIVIVIVCGIRYAIGGGDVSCMFSADPALCSAVKGLK